MSRAAGFVFAALVLATLGGALGAGRLGRSPNALEAVRAPDRFSPNADGRLDSAPVSLRVARSDDVRLSVLNAAGDEVRVLDERRALRAGELGRFTWDGRAGTGAVAPDGRYRLRVVLRREGRSLIGALPTRLDTTPPGPSSIGSARTGRAGRRSCRCRAGDPRRCTCVRRAVRSCGSSRWPPARRAPCSRGGWRPARRPGRGTAATAAVARSARAPTSSASRPSTAPATSAPRPSSGATACRSRPTAPRCRAAEASPCATSRSSRPPWRSRRVRSPRSASTRAGAPTTGRYGAPAPRERCARDTRRTPVLRVRVPAAAGLYELSARSRAGAASVSLAVRARVHRPVLVVLPVMTWQGRNAVDDDGDGLPNLLASGLPARADRVFAGPAAGVAERDVPLLAWLDRTRRSYDVTTDVALARGEARGSRATRASCCPPTRGGCRVPRCSRCAASRRRAARWRRSGSTRCAAR